MQVLQRTVSIPMIVSASGKASRRALVEIPTPQHRSTTRTLVVLTFCDSSCATWNAERQDLERERLRNRWSAQLGESISVPSFGHPCLRRPIHRSIWCLAVQAPHAARQRTQYFQDCELLDYSEWEWGLRWTILSPRGRKCAFDGSFGGLTCTNNHTRSCCPHPTSSSQRSAAASANDLGLGAGEALPPLSPPVAPARLVAENP